MGKQSIKNRQIHFFFQKKNGSEELFVANKKCSIDSNVALDKLRFF